MRDKEITRLEIMQKIKVNLVDGKRISGMEFEMAILQTEELDFHSFLKKWITEYDNKKSIHH